MSTLRCLLFILLSSLAQLNQAFSPILPNGSGSGSRPLARPQSEKTFVEAARLLDDDSLKEPRLSASTVSSDLPSWINLPASKQVEVDFAKLENVELLVGRLAMGGAIGLVGKEIMTGESFFDQFVCLLTGIATTSVSIL